MLNGLLSRSHSSRQQHHLTLDLLPKRKPELETLKLKTTELFQLTSLLQISSSSEVFERCLATMHDQLRATNAVTELERLEIANYNTGNAIDTMIKTYDGTDF